MIFKSLRFSFEKQKFENQEFKKWFVSIFKYSKNWNLNIFIIMEKLELHFNKKTKYQLPITNKCFRNILTFYY